MKHMASVPKGFLRYYVLKLLKEKPMSGSEIMNEIEKRTDGHWKPSPGSIYPLIAWLQDKGYTEEVPKQEAGIKRYTLTDQGKAFLQEHVKRRGELRKKFEFLTPPFSRLPWFNCYPEKTRELVGAGKKLVMAGWSLLDSLREKYSDDIVKEATETLEQAAKKIEEITKKLKE
ncbi:MAG: PadR family transcriptional regulator [Candidatus Bathyarchaeota archaeon]|nr:MAG: PadR family transcriptional regulator [Candidatus Bathyarchaeota archaeon]